MNLRGVAETSLIEVLKNGTQQFLVVRRVPMMRLMTCLVNPEQSALSILLGAQDVRRN